MNKTEVAKMLTLASGFDRRKVDELTVEAWHSVPDIQTISYADAAAIVIAHQTGPQRDMYLVVGTVTDGVKYASRLMPKQIAEDVRAARGYELVGRDWSESVPIPADAREALLTLRQGEQRLAVTRFPFDEVGTPIDPGTVGKAAL